MSDEKLEWEYVATELWRIKVDGGHLYNSNRTGGTSTFVPDIDLTRYQSHLRDAYRQGYDAGIQDTRAQHGLSYLTEVKSKEDVRRDKENPLF